LERLGSKEVVAAGVDYNYYFDVAYYSCSYLMIVVVVVVAAAAAAAAVKNVEVS